MPCFICETCGCVDNTATGRYWTKDDKELWADDNLGKALCSECAPTHFKSGSPVTYSSYGKWHGKFEKRIPTKEEIESWDLLK